MHRLLTALLVLLLAGCTTVVDGRAVRAGGASPLPPRPFEIRLDGVDPCTLLTDTQRAELGLNGEPVFDRAYSRLYTGETSLCTTTVLEPVAFYAGIMVVTSAGAELYFGPSIVPEVSAIQVRDFPAVLVVPPSEGACTVAVDVAHGQVVDVQYGDGGREPPVPQPQLCDGAVALAGAVMDTLLAR